MDKPLEHIKKVCGGGDDADFVKNPITDEEISECVKKLGCVSLQVIAQERRKINIRR